MIVCICMPSSDAWNVDSTWFYCDWTWYLPYFNRPNCPRWRCYKSKWTSPSFGVLGFTNTKGTINSVCTQRNAAGRKGRNKVSCGNKIPNQKIVVWYKQTAGEWMRKSCINAEFPIATLPEGNPTNTPDINWGDAVQVCTGILVKKDRWHMLQLSTNGDSHIEFHFFWYWRD